MVRTVAVRWADRAEATAADHQALLDQALHRLPDGGTAYAQAFGQVQFVVQPLPRLERPVLDGLLEVLRDLEVQRDGTVAVERSYLYLKAHGNSVSPGQVQDTGPLIVNKSNVSAVEAAINAGQD
jgi:hypothetical protein